MKHPCAGSDLSRREFLRQGACLAPAGLLGLANGHPSIASETASGIVQEKSANTQSMVLDVSSQQLRESLLSACRWITAISQMKDDRLTLEKNSHRLLIEHWRGALRGEYSVADRKWDFFCPVWHTGQGIKALVAAHKLTKDQSLLESAKLGAQFIGNQRIANPADKNYGLIFGFEDVGNEVNTSAVLECVEGLMALSDETKDPQYGQWACDAVSWIARNAYLGQGLFRDAFAVTFWSWVPPPWAKRVSDAPGRPLIDDAVFLKVYQRTGDQEYRRIFYEIADRLLKDEDPPGNWINYAPCNAKAGSLHPRQAYWWGYPMTDAYKDSGKTEYLSCAIRAGEWYLNAMRHDGGLIRNTYRDFKTNSFGHATSGIACAVVLWQSLWEITSEDRWLRACSKALNYCMRLQFNNPSDPNLRGAVLEEVLAPNGTDRSPYYLRDLSTIFFVQATAGVLNKAGTT